MKLSIITPTFNSEKTFEEMLQSIRKQKNSEIELIVVDGGSTDRTIDIIRENEDIITKWISEPDRGISDAFNKGIKMASGDIIGIINSDDKLAGNILENLNRYFESDIDVLYGNEICFGTGVRPYVNKSDANPQNLYNYMSMSHQACFVRKSAYEKYGLFRLDFKCVMDRELLLRMLAGGAKFRYINKNLAWYRLEGMSQKTFYKYTLPENERISVMYGKKKWEAKIDTLKILINHTGSSFLEHFPAVERGIRKMLHKERKYVS